MSNQRFLVCNHAEKAPRPIHLVIALHLFALSAAVADSPVTFEIVATFDYPGALNTTLTGINNQGLISGYYYEDSSGNAHSFRLRVKRNN